MSEPENPDFDWMRDLPDDTPLVLTKAVVLDWAERLHRAEGHIRQLVGLVTELTIREKARESEAEITQFLEEESGK